VLCFADFVKGDEVRSNTSDNGPFANGVGASSVSVYSALDISVGVNVLAIGR
jgi:hypothetical protein